MASTPSATSAKLVESGESPRRIPPGRRREILRGGGRYCVVKRYTGRRGRRYCIAAGRVTPAAMQYLPPRADPGCVCAPTR